MPTQELDYDSIAKYGGKVVDGPEAKPLDYESISKFGGKISDAGGSQPREIDYGSIAKFGGSIRDMAPEEGPIRGLEALGGKLPGVPEPRNPITQPQSSLKVSSGDRSMGFGPSDFDATIASTDAVHGRIQVPAGEMRDALSAWGAKTFPRLTEEASKTEKTTNAVGRVLANFVSPDSLSKMLAISVGAEALPVLANLPGVASKLKDLPALLKALDVTASAAIPAAVAGKTAVDIAKGGVPTNYEDAVETGLNALIAGAGLYGAVKAGKSVLKAYPEGRSAPSAADVALAEKTGGLPGKIQPEVAAEAVTALQVGGRNLAASQWEKIAENGPVDLGGGRRLEFIRTPGASRGEGQRPAPDNPNYPQVVDTATGKVIVGGPIATEAWLHQQGFTKVSREAGGTISFTGEAPDLVRTQHVGSTRSAEVVDAPETPPGGPEVNPETGEPVPPALAPEGPFVKGQEFQTAEGTYRIVRVAGGQVRGWLDKDGKKETFIASIERFKGLVGPAQQSQPAVAEPAPESPPTPETGPSEPEVSPRDRFYQIAYDSHYRRLAAEHPDWGIGRLQNVAHEAAKLDAYGSPTPQEATIPEDKAPSPDLKIPSLGRDPLSPEPASPSSAPAAVAPEPEIGNKPEALTPKRHDYSTTQLNLPESVAQHVRAAADAIPDDQLAKDGRTKEVHATLKYALTGENPEEVAKLLEGERPVTVKLGKASIFKTDNGDVVKVDVDSPDLHKLNAKVSTLPNEDKYPDYVPHVTIATVKSGEGAQYDGQEIPGVTGQEIVLDSVSFSGKDGKATDIPLGTKPTVAENATVQPSSGDAAEGREVIASQPSPQRPTPVAAEPEKSIVEAGNEPHAPAGENPQALGGVPSEDVRGDGEGGDARVAGPERGQTDTGLDSGTGGEGTPAQPGEGTDSGAVGVSTGGEHRPGDRRGSDRGSTPTSTDYRITPDDHIGEGSIRQKANDNLSAIRLLKQIEAEGREATPNEQKALVKYVGWGGMPQAFMENSVPRDWQGVRAELDGLLSPEEFASARASTPNAHYTSPLVIDGIWKALERLGFGKNEIYSMIEPAMGAGHFFGMTPEGIASRALRVGIELDSITGRIARLLYPQVDVHVAGFEKVRLPNDYFDLAVSNVPFGNYGVHDPAYKRVPGVTKSIHDYFFAKALDKVRPGGVVAFITSNFTMDKGDPFIRKYLADRADLIGAIRLPNTAFKGNAGTEVTTDIIFLQKRAPQTPAAGETWAETKPVSATKKRPDGTTGEGTVQVNEYFERHPEMMLGKMGLEGTMYGPNQAALIGDLTPEKLQAAIDKLPEGVVKPWKAPESAFTTVASIPASGAVKEGAFTVHDGRVVVRQGDKLVPADIPADQAARIKAMIGVRDSVREVFRTQIEESTDRAINMAREKLNLVYDIFVKKHGYLHDRKNVRAYADDPDAPLVLSLEDWDSDNKTAKKTAVFRERTIDKYKPAEKADNATDALSISLNERGRLDWVRMQELTGKTPAELQEELGPLVYQNPAGKAWEPADEYLSGNVRAKLAEAENAARGNNAYQRNVDALKAVQPKDLEPGEINGRLGASWIPKEDVRDFVAELLEMEPHTVQIGHSEALATWTMKLTRPETVANKRTFGTDRFSGAELIEDALNLRNPTAYDWVGSGSERRQVVNEQQTLAARQMLEQIKERFSNWVWDNPDRSKRLRETYNQEFNSLRLREYDGSHLKFPGSSAAINLRKHQKNAVWRMVQAGNTLLAHVVGAGKTLEIVAGAMEMRRLGLAKKPMIVVPKNRVQGTAEEFLSMYPAANILVMSSEDFTPSNRQKMMGRIATGNWDSVIVSYESFEKLPVSDDTFNSYLQTQIDDLENYIRESKGDQADARIVKELEKSKKRLEAKLRDKADREAKDEALTFEELGVDQLFVDEFDSFKNLFFPTKMTRIAGIPNTESKRAFDMYIKSQHIVGMNSGKRGLVGATGTPIANSMAEMWTMQRYLQPQYLREHGLQHFDAWAQTFGEVQPTLEMSPDGGGLRIVNRFNKFVNIPELVAGFRLMADVQTADMLNLPVPKLKGGKMRTISAKASPEQMAHLQSLVRRAAEVKGKPPRKGGDNMLVIGTDGQKAALDIRLVDPGAPDNPGSKVNKAVDEIVRIWKQTAEKRSTQLVFLDRSTPAGPGERKFSVYDEMKEKLIARGIPKAEVAFIHDGDGDPSGAKKEQMFRDVNAGKIRVLIGGTQKMGVGVNVQRKLYAAHHLDAPYRPRDIEQRNGRLQRQGNENEEIEIINYVTEPSFDARSWDILRNKAYFIGQVMRGDVSVRTAEDVSDQAVTFAEISAIASGNPAIREKTIVDADVRKFDSLRARHQQQQAAVRRDLQAIPLTIKAGRDAVAKLDADIATRDAAKPEFTIGKETFTGKDARKLAGEALHKILDAHRSDMAIIPGREGFQPLGLGAYRGLRLQAIGSVYGLLDIKEGKTPDLPRVVISGKGHYEANTNQHGDPEGTIASVESVVRNLDGRKASAEREVSDAEKKLVDTKKIADQPFEQEQKLKALLARQDELAKLLQAKPEETAVSEGDEDPDTDHPEDLDDLQAMKSKAVAERPAKATAGPIAEYKPGTGRVKNPDSGWIVGDVDGRAFYSNGHFALEGAPPGPVGRNMVGMEKVVSVPAASTPVKPVALTRSEDKETPSRVWFDNGESIDAKYYDHLVKRFPDAKFVFAKQPNGTSAVYGTVADKTVGVIMGFRKETPPPAVREFITQQETPERNPERGAVPLGAAVQFLAQRFGDTGPQANYSGIGAMENVTVRNLSQLRRANAEGHTAALRAASSKAHAAAILRAAVPAITKALEGSGITWADMRLALIEGRLRGLKQRWEELADSVEPIPDDLIKEVYTQRFASLLEQIEGKQGIPEDVAQTAAALVEAEDWESVRAFIGMTFYDAADHVQQMMLPDLFDTIATSPQFREALGIYKRLVEKPMADNHALNEGVFSDALGPFDTYYPLIPVEREIQGGPGRRLPFRKPKNIANKFATGLAEGYEASTDKLRERIAKGVRGNDKASLLQTLEDEGLFIPTTGNADTIVFEGVEYLGKKVEKSPDRYIIKDGKSTHAPASFGIIPRWLYKELQPILEGEDFAPATAADKVVKALNTFSLAGPADLVFHAANLWGTVIANTPFLGTSIGKKILSGPIVKKFAAAVMIMNTDPTTEEAAANLIEMSKVGALPSRYGTETYSRRLAEELGAERKRFPFTFAPLLYGPNGLDVRARLLMWRLAKEINPGASPQQLNLFVNQLGNYVPELQGRIERAVKRYGIGPFYTAGSTMLRNGMNAITGMGPMPKKGLGLRLWQQLTQGAIGLIALWFLVHKAMTGKYPSEDKRSKFMAIPIGSGMGPLDHFRHGTVAGVKLGDAIWGSGPEVGYLNFAFFNPIPNRGMRALGIHGAFETKIQGGTIGQALESGRANTVNSILHPILGPVPRALWVGLTGKEAYLTGFRDTRGQLQPSFFPAVPSRTKAGWPATLAQAGAAARELNSFYGDLGSATGMLGREQGQKGNHYTRMIFDLVTPGLVTNATNPYSRGQLLRQQRAGMR